MKRLIASVLTAGAALSPVAAFALPWQEVAPKAVQYCAMNTPFGVMEETEANRKAADLARGKLCMVVQSSK